MKLREDMKDPKKLTAKQSIKIRATVQGPALFARPDRKALSEGPKLAETFELLLIKNGKLVFCSCPGRRDGAQMPLRESFSLDPASEVRIEEYIREPDCGFLAVGLPDRDRVLLITAVPGLADGEALGILVHIGAASVCRVLCHSFTHAVRMDAWGAEKGKGSMRTTDEITYRFVARMLYDCRRLLGGGGRVGTAVEVKDRRELSLHMQGSIEALLHFLGHSTVPDLPTFPLAYPYAGQWHAGRAAWMLLLVYAGLHRRYGKELLEHVRPEPDNEFLIPMLSYPAGNRAKLPEEFGLCAALAERYDMFFDVRRKQNRVFVRLCPLSMSTERQTSTRTYEPGPSRFRFHAAHSFWDFSRWNKN